MTSALEDRPIDWDTVVENLGLVGRIVNRVRWVFPYSVEDPDDLFQDGTLGLARAVQKFRPELGFRLSTYAEAWIRQYIQRGCETRQGRGSQRAGRDVVLVSLNRALGFRDADTVVELEDLVPSPGPGPDDEIVAVDLLDRMLGVLSPGEIRMFVYPLRVLAAEHGVSHQAIQQRRKKLRAQIRDRVLGVAA